MTLADIINGTFEMLAGVMVLNHCRILLKQKQVRGVSVLSTVFFTSWGFWNLYYYPSLHQLASFIGGLSIVTANTVYVWLMIRYRRN